MDESIPIPTKNVDAQEITRIVTNYFKEMHTTTLNVFKMNGIMLERTKGIWKVDCSLGLIIDMGGYKNTKTFTYLVLLDINGNITSITEKRPSALFSFLSNFSNK